jgi:hypothetical protein
MKEKGISILGLAETNTNWHHRKIKKKVMFATQKLFENSSISFSDNHFDPPDRPLYLPGGGLQLCTNHWIGRMISTIKDPRRMGRWTGRKFWLRDRKTLLIITAYRPCYQSISDTNPETITVTHQQKVLYRKDKWEDIDPRQQFMADINEEIKEIEKDPDNLCLLMWDANESIEDKSGAIRTLLSEMTLVDAFIQIAGEPERLSMYTRGKKRIDYILTSQALVQYILRVGYLSFWGLLRDILDTILGTKLKLTRPAKCHIGSKSKPNTIYKYKQYIDNQCNTHRIYDRAKELYTLSN